MTTASYLIQDGVPKPPVDRRPKNPRRKFPVTDMVKGQFFFVPGRAARSISSYISRITKNLPGTYEAAAVHAWQDQRDMQWHLCEPSATGATEGVGVWRTK